MTENSGSDLIISPADTAPASPFGPPLPAPSNEHEVAELYAAAHFLEKADSRYVETQMVAEEIHSLLGGDPFQRQADHDGPVRGADGRFAPSKYVPHSALHAERSRRKAAEAKASELEVKTARAEERLNVINQLIEASQQGQQQPQQQHSPSQQQHSNVDGFVDPEIDVFAAVQQLQQQNSRLQAERNEQRFLEAYKADAIRFAQANPDHFQAHAHLVAARDTELTVMGISDPAQRRRQIAAEERELVRESLTAGQSPSERIYNLAKTRGFTGGRRQVAQVPQPSRQAVEQVQRIQNGVNASATLSGAGGTGGAGLTVQQLADMPEDQFDALIKKMGGINSPAVQRAFGGG